MIIIVPMTIKVSLDFYFWFDKKINSKKIKNQKHLKALKYVITSC